MLEDEKEISLATTERKEEEEQDWVRTEPRRKWFLGEFFLAWVLPYVFKGYRAYLEEEDVPRLEKEDGSAELVRLAEKHWNHEVQTRGEKASLVRVLFQVHRKDLSLGIFYSVLQALLFTVGRPLLLREIILIVSDDDDDASWKGSVLAVGLAVVVLLEGVLQAQVKQVLSTKLGTRFAAWAMTLMQRKSTRVSSTAVETSGLQESALVGSDVVRLLEDWRWMCLLPFVVTALIGGVAVLAYTLGVASLPGFAVMFSIVAVNWKLTKLVKKVEMEDLALGDRRITILKEVLSGIKAIKMMAWEYPFEELITDARTRETALLQKFRTLVVTSINLGRSSPVLSACLSIMVLAVLRPEDVNAANIFVAITAFLSLRLPLIGISQQTAMAANTLVSLGRMRRFMLLPDSPEMEVLDDNSEYSVEIKNAAFQWKFPQTSPPSTEEKEEEDEAEFKISNVNVTVERAGGLVAVVGRVGSGKSSFISSLVGETVRIKGSIRVARRCAYVPQNAFVLSGTLLDNILMGLPYDEERFRAAVRASALDGDLELFPRRELTEIGERGQTLSGGQKQRLSIARALYSDPDLLILDDPLSAVDPEVTNTIFQRAVLGFLKSNGRRSVLMALNQLHLLPYFTHIIVLQDGQVVEQGTYEELKQQNGGLLASMIENVDEFDDANQELRVDNVADIDAATFPNEDSKDDLLLATEASSTPNEPDKMGKSDEEEAGKTSKKRRTLLGDLISIEKGARGAVSKSIVLRYFKAMGIWKVPVSFLLALIAYALMAASDLWLAYWVRDSEASDLSRSRHLKNAGIYIGLSLAHVFGVQALSIHNTRASVAASRRLHHDAIERLLHAPITWYESTPSGRIVSRFSGDLSMVDRQLAFIFDDTFQFVFILLALVIVVCVVVPILVTVIVFGLVLFTFQLVAVDRSNREVKRYSNQSLSPVLTNLAETINARPIIRAMNLEGFFTRRQERYVNRYCANIHFSFSLVNWGTMISGFVSFLLTTVAALVVVLNRDQFEPAYVGLALTYSFIIPYFLSILSVVIPIGFAALTSLERILEYLGDEVPQEPAWHTDKDDDDNFPSSGKVSFENASLIYRPGLPPALKNINFTIKSGEKIGVVGKTGAGKSSLTLLLFRVHEVAFGDEYEGLVPNGRVEIDGQDISQLGLQLVRKSLTVIPQQPLLLRGTVRNNLDPFNKYDDETLRNALNKVGLSETSFDENAFSLSIGERQLLSLARVLLKDKLPIIVMDEPTSSIDQETDNFIQKIVREEFRDSTLITIAHRINTIIDSDRILVMSEGQVVEFDTPANLCSNPQGYLYKMIAAMGPTVSKNLFAKANMNKAEQPKSVNPIHEETDKNA